MPEADKMAAQGADVQRLLLPYKVLVIGKPEVIPVLCVPKHLALVLGMPKNLTLILGVSMHLYWF